MTEKQILNGLLKLAQDDATELYRQLRIMRQRFLDLNDKYQDVKAEAEKAVRLVAEFRKLADDFNEENKMLSEINEELKHQLECMGRLIPMPSTN